MCLQMPSSAHTSACSRVNTQNKDSLCPDICIFTATGHTRDVSETNTSRDRQDCLLKEKHQAEMKLPVFSSLLRHGQAGQPCVSHLPPPHRKGNISIFLLKCVGAQG